MDTPILIPETDEYTAEETCALCSSAISKRLRQLRQDQGLSIRNLANRSGVSVNTLSLIENERTSPSVNTLVLLARGLGVPLVTFFTDDEEEYNLVYQQSGKRELINFKHCTVEKLGEGLLPLGAEPILVTLKPGQKGGELISHNGREFIFCLEGVTSCSAAGRVFQLRPGDSLLFDATVPHCWWNAHAEPSRLLVIFCPMEGSDLPAEHHLSR